jgi:hypothetical protein
MYTKYLKQNRQPHGRSPPLGAEGPSSIEFSSIEHIAHNRDGFALGAVIAAR